MYITAFTLGVFALVNIATASSPSPNSGSAIEALTQAGYKTAWLIDSQNYSASGEVMTKDVVYDSTDLGAYGGKTNGLEQTVAEQSERGLRPSHHRSVECDYRAPRSENSGRLSRIYFGDLTRQSLESRRSLYADQGRRD